MIQVSPLVLLALGELLLISIVATLGLVLFGFVRKRNERRAIARLIGHIKEDQIRRRDETRSLMQENFGIEGEALDSIVNKISREEKRLYQALINLFLKRDTDVLEVLHVECEGVTEPYRNIELPEVDASESEVESDLVTEVAMLKGEKERLSTELGVTMDTMGTMLKEYASMYGGGADGELDKEKLIKPFSASASEGQNKEPASEPPAESLAPAQIGQDEIDIGAEEFADVDLDEDHSGLFDDAVDIDIGEALGDETLVIDDPEELAVLNDETLVVDIGGDELVELDDEDLSLDKTGIDKG